MSQRLSRLVVLTQCSLWWVWRTGHHELTILCSPLLLDTVEKYTLIAFLQVTKVLKK